MQFKVLNNKSSFQLYCWILLGKAQYLPKKVNMLHIEFFKVKLCYQL